MSVLHLKFGLCFPVLKPTLVDYWNDSHAVEDQAMVIGERLRALREEKKLTQGDIEKRTGFLCCHISRVENGYMVPTVESLEKFARALEVPIYQLLYDGEEPPKLPNLPKRKTADDILWGNSGKDARLLAKFCRLFSRMEEDDLGVVLLMAQKMARLSCHRFRSNEVRLWLSVIAYNLGNLWRRLVLPQRIGNWSLASLQLRLVKTGGRLVKHARYYWLLLAESHLTRRLFGAMLGRIAALPLPAG